MRRLVFLAGLLLALPAMAQEPPKIFGFYLGMPVAEARDVAPDTFVLARSDSEAFNATRYAANFGGLDTPLNLFFDGGRLEAMQAQRQVQVADRAECLARLEHLTRALEEQVGPMPHAELARRKSDVEPTRTRLGSHIRRYDEAQGAGGGAVLYGPIFAEAMGWWFEQEGRSLCQLSYEVSVGAPFTDLPPPTLEDVDWAARPSNRDVVRYYPSAAMRFSRSGVAILTCAVGAAGELTCEVSYEAPRYLGFGEAATRIATRFRAPLETADGVSTEGAIVRLPIRFRSVS